MLSGFRNFVLRGNIVDLAVAFIVATSFAAVVTTFTEWLTELLPETDSQIFGTGPGTFGAFLNATIAFVMLAAIVYFFVVTPYTKAKERYFPDEPAGTPADVALLEEIRDLLATQGTHGSAAPVGESPKSL